MEDVELRKTKSAPSICWKRRRKNMEVQVPRIDLGDAVPPCLASVVSISIAVEDESFHRNCRLHQSQSCKEKYILMTSLDFRLSSGSSGDLEGCEFVLDDDFLLQNTETMNEIQDNKGDLSHVKNQSQVSEQNPLELTSKVTSQ
mmetsp:Transcript_2643/g.4742  ORF Transcript_2643/g.4742 Transcript_2643/m.4742 type:complete len:144 (-) Transcript_2643:342-773(-)